MMMMIRVRKVLTEQLHVLRKELGPKEKQLINADEKVQDVEREYGIALQVSHSLSPSIHSHSHSLSSTLVVVYLLC
jgi:hypothetical protein